VDAGSLWPAESYQKRTPKLFRRILWPILWISEVRLSVLKLNLESIETTSPVGFYHKTWVNLSDG
jgi:hypothetical protein